LEAGFKDAQQELHHLSHHSNRPRPDDMVIDDHGSNIPNYKEDETTHFLAMRVLVFMRWIRLATPFFVFCCSRRTARLACKTAQIPLCPRGLEQPKTRLEDRVGEDVDTLGLYDAYCFFCCCDFGQYYFFAIFKM
jgi:hypothetical protein